MPDDYRHGDEFKTGVLSASAKRVQLEGKRQGRESFRSGHGDEGGKTAEARQGDAAFQIVAQVLDTAAETARILQRLSELELAAAEALEDAQRREDDARDLLERIRKAATHTEDGRAVYRTADGKQAFDEQGNELTAAEIAAIEWKPGAPTWEEREQAVDLLEIAMQDRQEIEDYQDRLQAGRERLEGGTLTPDGLDELERDLEAVPRSVRDHNSLKEPITAAAQYQGEAITAAPLQPPFTVAARHIRSAPTDLPAPIPAKTLDF